MDYINEIIWKNLKKEDKKFFIKVGIEVLEWLQEKVDKEEESVDDKENEKTGKKPTSDLSDFFDAKDFLK
ncbi:MAG: hypothetical protein M0R46_01025 [Candidatus Muirbacterium halophilum]|nr:hypothetical protein [Candidatus Muirbacterium halophilum]MCK9474477.1 hypothetical protein [Candidatus Muirbacterium halophilum]